MWEETARRVIQGKGSLHYLSLDPKCKSIVYSSNHEYKFTLDTVNEIITEVAAEPMTENPQKEESESPFKWTQDVEDITINFKRVPDSTKDQYNVKCQKSHIEVKCEAELLVDSDLFAEVDTDLTTWSLENDFMQLNLVKKDADLIWPYLTPGGPMQDVNSEKHPELNNAPISDLNSQMEECDYGDEGHQDEEFFIGNFKLFNLNKNLMSSFHRAPRCLNPQAIAQSVPRYKSSPFRHNTSTWFSACTRCAQRC